MSAYTPGPWAVGWGKGLTGPTTPAIDGPTAAGKRLPFIPVSRGRDTIAIVPQQSNAVMVENARLISAAPDGIAAARTAYAALLARPHDTWRIRNQHVYAALRDFIAKATGRDSEDVQNEYEAAAMEGQS